jgi:hypothetical protein
MSLLHENNIQDTLRGLLLHPKISGGDHEFLGGQSPAFPRSLRVSYPPLDSTREDRLGQLVGIGEERE